MLKTPVIQEASSVLLEFVGWNFFTDSFVAENVTVKTAQRH